MSNLPVPHTSLGPQHQMNRGPTSGSLGSASQHTEVFGQTNDPLPWPDTQHLANCRPTGANAMSPQLEVPSASGQQIWAGVTSDSKVSLQHASVSKPGAP